jgi:hypothetical protein
MARVTLTAEAVAEFQAWRAAGRARVLRIGRGGCGLRRPVAAAAAEPEPGDALLEVDGLPVAVAPTLGGAYRVTVSRGRFGTWFDVVEEQA